ncbi:start domain containing protein [Stylonychia lemnae]|uniref:Start domain containing protein n=1 Tax=Stylonychia lemnae TaxID=5949 RepID=A0A078B845_STYLE|nr:start domain containing protein [Stylonychia lemnae]|eukprot:CDW89743.1 start domain containing protein [Stylonychia lemnae]
MSLQMSEVPKIVRTIEGNIILKRKSLYVKRYAKIENHIFLYKKEKGDSKIRAQIDLRIAKIKKSLKIQQDANYIQISLNKDSILIAIENVDEFQNWVSCIEFNQKSDQEQQEIIKKQQQLQESMLKPSQTMPVQKDGNLLDRLDTDGNNSQASKQTRSRPRGLKSNNSAKFKKDSLTPQELQQAKQRLQQLSSKNWILMNGKEGSLVYADRKVDLSLNKQLIQELKTSEVQREKDSINSKTNVVILLLMFSLIIGIDFLAGLNISQIALLSAKLLLGLLTLGVLGKQLVNKSSRKNLKQNLIESFDVKSVTYLVASPDEIANILTDEKTRQFWDPCLKSVEKLADDTFKLTYQGGELNSFIIETVKYNFVLDGEGNYLIQEKINSDQYRYYELQQVQNKPYFMRITFYGRVTPVLFECRGKDVYRGLNYLRNFVSQSNRPSTMQLVFQKSGDNVNEMFASLRTTAFNDYIEEEDESDDEEVISENQESEPSSATNDNKSKSQLEESKSLVRAQSEKLVESATVMVADDEIYTHEISTDTKIVEIKSIMDWDSRLHLYKPENIKYLRMAQAKFKEYEDQIPSAEWKILTEDKKEGLKIWQRTSESGLKCMKAQAIIERKASDIIKVIGDTKYRNDYDPVYDHSNFLEKVAHQTFIVYQKTKKVAVVSSRDFIFVLHLNKMPDGTIYALVFSIDRDDLHPPEKNSVRGWLQLGGWKLQPMAEDPSKTLCTYQTEIDMKGSIPGFVMTQANKDIGYQIVKLRKTVEKYLRENP